jgi:hypothetical protein
MTQVFDQEKKEFRVYEWNNRLGIIDCDINIAARNIETFVERFYKDLKFADKVALAQAARELRQINSIIHRIDGKYETWS